MKTRAIFFDLGNTLVSYYHKEDFLPVLEQSVQRCLDVLSRDGLAFEYPVVLETAISQDPGRPNHRVTRIEQRLGVLFGMDVMALHGDALVEAFMGPIFATSKVMEGTLDLLEKLKRKGMPMVLVSNAPWGSPADLWREHLHAIGIAPWFDHLVFCTDVGWRKPHPEIFHHALNKVGLEAKDVLFVGDDPEWDVKGAEGVGMQVVVLDARESQGVKGINTVTRIEQVLDYIEF